MALTEVKYEELLSVRKTLVKEINKRITDDECAFLVSFKERKPKWDMLDIKGAQDMPAVKWKLANLMKMNDQKHKRAVYQLKKIIKTESNGIAMGQCLLIIMPWMACDNE